MPVSYFILIPVDWNFFVKKELLSKGFEWKPDYFSIFNEDLAHILSQATGGWLYFGTADRM